MVGAPASLGNGVRRKTLKLALMPPWRQQSRQSIKQHDDNIITAEFFVQALFVSHGLSAQTERLPVLSSSAVYPVHLGKLSGLYKGGLLPFFSKTNKRSVRKRRD